MKKPRLQHVSLAITENGHEKVRAFYNGVLGLEEKPIPQSLAHLHVIWFAVGDGEMELHFIPDRFLPQRGEARHFCLEVDDLDGYRRRLTHAGYEVVEAEPIPLRPRFFSHDPFGNLIEFTTIEGEYQQFLST